MSLDTVDGQAATRKDPPRRKRTQLSLAGQELAIVWTAVVFVGAAWIALAARGGAARHVLPVVFMLAYLLFGVTRTSGNTTRLADSLYFMGFLWTLWALIVNLIFAGRTVKADSVFIIFGYALITTAAGMLFRLMLIQFQRTLPDQVLEARAEIDSGVAAFGEELLRAEAAILRFGERANASLETLLRDMSANAELTRIAFEEHQRRVADEISAQAAEAVRGVVDRMGVLSSAVGTTAGSVSAFTREFDSSAKAVSDSVGRVRTTLARRVAALEDTLNNLVTRLEALDAPRDLFKAPVERLASDLEGRVGDFARLLDELAKAVRGKVDEFAAAVQGAPMSQQIALAMQRNDEALASLTRQSETLNQSALGVFKTVGDAAASIDALRAAAAGLTSLVEGVAGRHIAASEEVVRELKANAEKVHTAVQEAVHLLSTVAIQDHSVQDH